MINKLTFENYKLFEEEQTLELKPLTLLIGKNSTGKSALTKLPVILEGALSGQHEEGLLPRYRDVELGGEFRDLVYQRSAIKPLRVGLYNSNESLRVELRRTESFGAEIFSWHHTKGEEEITLNHEETFKGFVPQSKESVIAPFEFRSDYIGPFRYIPARFIPKPQQLTRNSLFADGFNAYNLLIMDMFNGGTLIEKVDGWFQKHFGGWGIRINKDTEQHGIYQFELYNGELGINLRDVGQGIHQALPLVVRAFYPVERDTLISLEQPELHLHPAAHGDLAQLFAESVEDGKRRYLIETHSQNFVLRMQRLVAEQRFRAEDIVIYFVDFDETKKSSFLRKINLDEHGNVDFWPEGIFEESLEEAIAINDAQSQN